MALPTPTTLVAATATFTTSDITTGSQVLNRVLPAVVFKAVNVQYQGFVNIPATQSYLFTPFLPVTSFAVVYVRNLGGAGSGNTVVNLQPTGGGPVLNVFNLDVGAFMLYISPQLASITISGIAPGFTEVFLVAGATTTSNLEVLVAG